MAKVHKPRKVKMPVSKIFAYSVCMLIFSSRSVGHIFIKSCKTTQSQKLIWKRPEPNTGIPLYQNCKEHFLMGGRQLKHAALY